jgi:polyhydroxyalkanoate synthesis regulator phasin
MLLDDIRKTFEAVMGQLSPAKARQLAKRFLEPGAAKDQVSKTAAELVQLSQRMRASVRKEVASQIRSMGVATQDEVEALRKRVRDLERAAGKRSAARRSSAVKTGTRAKSTASSRSRSSRKPSAAS